MRASIVFEVLCFLSYAPNSVVVVVVVVVCSEPRVYSLHGTEAATGVPAEGIQRLAHKDAL